MPFLSGADAGVIPIRHFPNHEIALITKFFEYSHARLPIVVSDVKTMAETVRRTGQGEVFEADNLEDFVRAVRAVLADPESYRRRTTRLACSSNGTGSTRPMRWTRYMTGYVANSFLTGAARPDVRRTTTLPRHRGARTGGSAAKAEACRDGGEFDHG